ncbi:unnamed protein product [Dovyalis caffra]|uniref:Uncharacterized protein n=1 Tax=Dovyalis caffra TaxID=77055 RepID=A0AAV1RLF0_9ROSI|nr:unnamed protein product [Dovyalis caffra]
MDVEALKKLNKNKKLVKKLPKQKHAFWHQSTPILFGKLASRIYNQLLNRLGNGYVRVIAVRPN